MRGLIARHYVSIGIVNLVLYLALVDQLLLLIGVLHLRLGETLESSPSTPEIPQGIYATRKTLSMRIL
jgi:hypothetical protein